MKGRVERFAELPIVYRMTLLGLREGDAARDLCKLCHIRNC